MQGILLSEALAKSIYAMPRSRFNPVDDALSLLTGTGTSAAQDGLTMDV